MYSYLKLLFKVTHKNPLKSFKCEFTDQKISQKKLNSFCQLFAVQSHQELPLSYAFIAAFPYLIKVLADKRFALPPMGLIHLSSEFIEHHTIDYLEKFSVTLSVEQNISDSRGRLVDIKTNIYQHGKLCITNENRMLKRVKKVKRAPSSNNDINSFTGDFLKLITSKKITTYSKVSGDLNPIHLSHLFAQLMGFPKPIAHGMYLLNLAIATSKHRPTYILAEFKKPCFVNTITEINLAKDRIIVFSDKDKLHLDIAFRV